MTSNRRMPRDPWNDDPVLQFLTQKGVTISPFELGYQRLRERAVEQMAKEVESKEADLRKEIGACRAEIKKRVLPKLIPLRKNAEAMGSFHMTGPTAANSKALSSSQEVLGLIRTIEHTLNSGTLTDIITELTNLDKTDKSIKIMAKLKFRKDLVQSVFDIEAHMDAKNYGRAAEELLKLQLALDIK